jgi:hypothetical protein
MPLPVAGRAMCTTGSKKDATEPSMLPLPLLAAGSLIAIAGVAALTRWLNGEQQQPLKNLTTVEKALRHDMFGFTPVDMALADDGLAALARDPRGQLAILFVIGDRQVARRLDSRADQITRDGDTLTVQFADLGSEPRRLSLPDGKAALWHEHWLQASHV